MYLDMPGSVKREIIMYIPLKRRVEEYNELDPVSNLLSFRK